MLLFQLTPSFLFSQNSCPNPDSFSTVCVDGTGTCGVPGNTCEYTTTFLTDFTGNNKYARITIYANGSQVFQECVGPMDGSSTPSYSVTYNAVCGATITGSYDAYTNSSGQNPCGGTTCDFGSCANGECQSSTILPISLVSFDAVNKGDQILLSWVTSYEQNNDHFIVERSQNGSEWQYFESINGIGSAEGLSQYSLADALPFSGANYYRLLQVDQDGSRHISGITYVHYEHTGSIFTFDSESKSLLLAESFNTPIIATLVSMQGMIVLRNSYAPGESIVLDHLISGIYLVHLQNSEMSYSQKLVLP